MNKSLTIFKVCLYSVLFVYFISCGHKIEQDTPEALVISKCSDVIVRGDCDGKKIGAQDCQWNVNDGKCEDKTPVENENNPPVDPLANEEPIAEEIDNPPAAEEAVVEENNPPAVEEPIVNENENNPPAAPPAVEEPVAKEIDNPVAEEPVAEEKNNPIKPTECSHYSVDNDNLQQCGTENLGKDKKNKAIKCDVDVKNNKCKRVKSCENIVSGPDKGQSRCQPQGCFWRKEKSIFGKIKENSKESCHTTGEDKPKNK